MKHFILGTAGHIDHGKTTLVKALTGIECDTHKEEKTRGITINLGFAHLTLPDGNSIGIVDVPGHADFVNTMVAGASGIDIVMLVVAADSGVMPQTIEHLRIMEILGIKKGFIVLTKTDIVSPDLTAIAEEEIDELLKGTFLENCPVIKTAVSEKGTSGIEEIKNTINLFVNEIEERKGGEIFRLFIDRIFTVKGFGTVVTGSVLGGVVKQDDKVFLMPDNKELRVRRLERHGEEVKFISAGDRASINLAGLNRDEFSKGMMISDQKIEPTKMVDAGLKLFHQNKNFELWSHALFLIGTFQSRARIHLIDKDKLKPGEEAVVQIHLEDECVAVAGDRFVLRSTSGDITLGGGEVIDAHPLHHKRRPEKLVSNLKRISKGGIPERIAAEVQKQMSPVSDYYLAALLNLSKEETTNYIDSLLPDEIDALKDEDDCFLLTSVEKNKLIKKIIKNIENYHKRNPLDNGGRRINELTGIFGINKNADSETIIKLLINLLHQNKEVKTINGTWALTSHKVFISENDKRAVKIIEEFISNSGMKTPLLNAMMEAVNKLNISEEKLKQILTMLAAQNKAYNIDGNFIRSELVDQSRERILRFLGEYEKGITIAEFRDLIGGNRKISLLLLSQYDSESITIRSGDYRVITKKGEEKLAEIKSKNG